nr:TPA_asm: M88 uORF RNA 2 [Murid betaherpesvirus 1]DBA07842.1 TPA_asm: M88 uORF RNA 2 [Murid betaherpesvirus 1]
MLIGWRR